MAVTQINCMTNPICSSACRTRWRSRRAVRAETQACPPEAETAGGTSSGGEPARCAGSREIRRRLPGGDKKNAVGRDWRLLSCIRCGLSRGRRIAGGPKLRPRSRIRTAPDVALQPGKVRYRKGDHELMPNIFVVSASTEGRSEQCRHDFRACAATGRVRRGTDADGRTELIGRCFSGNICASLRCFGRPLARNDAAR